MDNNKNPQQEFIKDFIKAQSCFEIVVKSGKNDFLKSKYATYKDIWDAVGESLNSNGFAIIHKNLIVDGQLIVQTALWHKEGHFECSNHPVVIDKAGTSQSMGSGESYAQKYNLKALTGVVIVDALDDDGEADRKSKPSKAPTSKYEVKSLFAEKGIIQRGDKKGMHVSQIEDVGFLKWMKTKAIKDLDQYTISEINSILGE